MNAKYAARYQNKTVYVFRSLRNPQLWQQVMRLVLDCTLSFELTAPRTQFHYAVVEIDDDENGPAAPGPAAFSLSRTAPVPMAMPSKTSARQVFARPDTFAQRKTPALPVPSKEAQERSRQQMEQLCKYHRIPTMTHRRFMKHMDTIGITTAVDDAALHGIAKSKVLHNLINTHSAGLSLSNNVIAQLTAGPPGPPPAVTMSYSKLQLPKDAMIEQLEASIRARPGFADDVVKYVLAEDMQLRYRVQQKIFDSSKGTDFPRMHYDGHPIDSPFRRPRTPWDKTRINMPTPLLYKRVQERKKRQEETAETPKVPAPKEAYCEVCKVTVPDIDAHVARDAGHLQFASDHRHYAKIDSLFAQLEVQFLREYVSAKPQYHLLDRNARKELGICEETVPRHLRLDAFELTANLIPTSSSLTCGLSSENDLRSQLSAAASSIFADDSFDGFSQNGACVPLQTQTQSQSQSQTHSHSQKVAVSQPVKKDAVQTRMPFFTKDKVKGDVPARNVLWKAATTKKPEPQSMIMHNLVSQPVRTAMAATTPIAEEVQLTAPTTVQPQESVPPPPTEPPAIDLPVPRKAAKKAHVLDIFKVKAFIQADSDDEKSNMSPSDIMAKAPQVNITGVQVAAAPTAQSNQSCHIGSDCAVAPKVVEQVSVSQAPIAVDCEFEDDDVGPVQLPQSSSPLKRARVVTPPPASAPAVMDTPKSGFEVRPRGPGLSARKLGMAEHGEHASVKRSNTVAEGKENDLSVPKKTPKKRPTAADEAAQWVGALPAKRKRVSAVPDYFLDQDVV